MLADWSADIEIPLAPKPLTNARMDWRVRSSHVKKERKLLRNAWIGHGKPMPPAFPCSVTFIRHSAGKLDDDNLPSAFKSMRDELAKIFGLKDDAGAEVRWAYQQEKAPPKKGRTTIRIECSYERSTTKCHGASGRGEVNAPSVPCEVVRAGREPEDSSASPASPHSGEPDGGAEDRATGTT